MTLNQQPTLTFPEVPPETAQTDVNLLDLSALVRSVALEMIHQAGSGHIGSSLSCADLLTTLRFTEMRWSARAADRDVFVLSKGHAAPAWYAALVVGGDLDPATVEQLRVLDSPLQGHPDRLRCEFVDASTGALGQGLSIALGRAEARRLRGAAGQVYCLLGDGECQEGQVWEAALYAGARPVTNVVAVVDRNGMQSDGPVDQTVSLGDLGAKFRSFGWLVQEIDGHSHQEIAGAFESARLCFSAPSVIVANTLKGNIGTGRQLLGGAHGGSLTVDEYSDALHALGRRR